MAMAATAMAIPILLKRGDTTAFFKCVSNVAVLGKWECSSEILKVDMGIVTGIAINPLTIELKPAGGAEFSLSSPNLQVSVITPPFLPNWPLKEAKGLATIEFEGIDIATLVKGAAPTTVANGKVSTTLPPSDLSIVVGAEAIFSRFVAALLEKQTIAFRLKGSLDATLEINTVKIPPSKVKFTIPGLAFNSPITLVGCNSFPKIEFSKLISITQDATSKSYILVADVSIFNPSELIVKLGELKFKAADLADQPIGTTVFDDFHLELGQNILRSTTTTDGPISEALLGTLTKEGGTFKLSGYEGSSANKILAAGLSKFKTDIEIPVLPKPTPA
ncbi:hypothetical protein BGZ72_009947 [Mortierella alpina]|nr:hypothetical protein BGZ72_009947 [Mortierella alpina]